MAGVEVVQTFADIPIVSPRTLVLCDIDDTVLYWENHLQDFYMTAVQYFPHAAYNDQINYAKNLQYYYRKSVHPRPIDAEGFDGLLARLSPTSKLEFITARANAVQLTRQDFTNIGINYDNFTTHYVGDSGMSKGGYIQQHINLYPYDDVIFIDDNPEYIMSVQFHFPNIRCYQFIRQR